MNRKILQAGPATLAISLPMSWVKKFNLEKGQELDIEEQGSSLKITTKRSFERDSALIDISSHDPIAHKLLGMLYKAGYTKIKATYTPSKKVTHKGKIKNEIDMIKDVCGHLTGMQLWEVGKNSIGNFASIIDTAKVNKEEFANTSNKLFMHVVHQSEQVKEALSKNKDIFDEALLTEQLTDQSADFCTRIILAYGHQEHTKTHQYYDLITKLEIIGDKLFHMILNYKNGEKAHPHDIHFLAIASESLKDLNSIYRKFNPNTLKNQGKIISQAILDCRKNIKNKDIISNLITFDIYSVLIEIDELIEKLFFLNYDSFKTL